MADQQLFVFRFVWLKLNENWRITGSTSSSEH